MKKMVDISERLVFRACRLATKAHKGQTRKYTGQPYIRHPGRVAGMAKEMDLPEEAVAAAWLHDVVEDCDVTFKEIQEQFGERVAFLVMALSDLQTPEDGNRATRKTAYAHKIHMLQDEEAHTLKCLDLIDNAPSIRDHDPKFWKLYQEEAKFLLGYLTEAQTEAKDRLRDILEGTP